MSTVTDPIADLLARVRNAARAQKPEMFVPYSKIKAEIVRILKEEGYITDYAWIPKRRIRGSRSRTRLANRVECDHGIETREPARSAPLRWRGGDSARAWWNGQCRFSRRRAACFGSGSEKTKRGRRVARLRLVSALLIVMSRIGNKPVEIPAKVKVNIGDDGAVAVEGPKGKLNWNLPRNIKGKRQGQSRLARSRS